MEAIIRKWGNSPALRLPTSVLKEAGYRLEQKVEYDLDTLVGGITARNAHGEISFGEPVGKEAL